MFEANNFFRFMAINPQWLRQAEICARYGVGRDQLRTWCEKKWIKFCRTSERNVVYRCADVDRVLNELAVGRMPLTFDKYDEANGLDYGEG